ncbi:uncharacterized protein K444DRAFT_629655 [Hyaloscypha bicolor E]|uniref:Uncharacterized protein n=1 Tax=Hyaloscypha bicolor E TaxID=1095630 RepID=A0A2J6TBC9_9HELO|nr:uncharacterized protein K444DRAFT_629655 [Hyaloscypha bicolor E]PMD60268.1 hypothetical protein K444DRAFT_629655 [Hyaloscypha bicolor E]
MASMEDHMSKPFTGTSGLDVEHITEGESQKTRNGGVDRHTDSDDNGDNEFPPFEERLKPKTTSALSNQGRKRNISVSNRARSPARKRHCDRASSLAAATPPLIIIDLTTNIELCALCPNVLRKGDGRMFVLRLCGCVICDECLSNELELLQSCNDGITLYWCPKHVLREQSATELFALDCRICWGDNVADNSDRVCTKCVG